jgi:hypothetical protein
MDSLKMSKNYLRPLSLLVCIPILAACSTITNGSTQLISFKTVGADDAYCEMQSGENDYKYTVRPPQSVWVQRSRKPLNIVCTAPGNRVQNLTVESTIAGAAIMNGATAGTTLPWDAATGAMYQYPEEIMIDFTAVVAKNRPLPSYENNGAHPSDKQGIEFLGPDSPEVPSDKVNEARYKAAYDEDARLQAENAAIEVEKQRRIDAVEGGFYGDKGHTQTSGKEVVIAPITESVPVANDKTSPMKASKDDGETIIPQSNSKLGKPIFPSSTTF